MFSLQLADHSKHPDAIKTVQLALLQRKKLVGTYDSPHETRPRKVIVHPYRLCLVKNAWYVVGRLDCETVPKTFRVARFKTLRMLDESADVPNDFNLRTYFGNAWAVYRGAKSYAVQLTFTPDASRLVVETIWHHTQQVQYHRDGSATLKFEVDGLDEIVNWLLSWTGRVRVQKPEELKELFLSKLRDGIEVSS